MITVFIVDDHKILRDGIRALLDKEDDIRVIGEADTGRGAIDAVGLLHPDVIVMDIGMPDMNGIDAAKEILSMMPDARVLALSMYSDKRFVVEMMKTGAKGYLVKDCAFEDMLTAVRSVASNQRYIAPSILNIVVEDFIHHQTRDESTQSLTSRELEILRLVAQGFNTKEIANNLSLSVKTIDAHRQHIMNKLNIHNTVDLTKYAIRAGLISL